MATADPSVASWTPINMFAMLRAIATNAPILTIDGTTFPITNGTTGTFAGQATKGATLIDYINGVAYINTGTLASPIWSVDSGPVSGLGGLGTLANAKMTYDFTVDGGAATSTIVPANSPTLPINSIILGGTVDVTVACVGAGSISLGTTAGSGVASLKTATAAASYAINSQQPIIPLFTAATYLKLTAAGRLSLTTSVGTITAGRFDLNVAYIVGN